MLLNLHFPTYMQEQAKKRVQLQVAETAVGGKNIETEISAEYDRLTIFHCSHDNSNVVLIV